MSGKVLKEENPLGGTHVTIKVIPASGGFPITFDEVETDDKGEFTYTFRVPKETITGSYEVVVQANGEVNKSQKLDLVILEEKKSDVKVSFNYSECTVKLKGYIPEKGDLIITTTGLKEEEIKSVTVKTDKEKIITITQRPEWPEGGYPKSKTRAFGKAVGSGEAIIIATVIDINGNEYTAQCKVKVQ